MKPDLHSQPEQDMVCRFSYRRKKTSCTCFLFTSLLQNELQTLLGFHRRSLESLNPHPGATLLC